MSAGKPTDRAMLRALQEAADLDPSDLPDGLPMPEAGAGGSPFRPVPRDEPAPASAPPGVNVSFGDESAGESVKDLLGRIVSLLEDLPLRIREELTSDD